MGFEWDEEKRTGNLNKHGIDFVRAVKISENPIVKWLDEREEYGEERYIAPSHANAQFLVVV